MRLYVALKVVTDSTAAVGIRYFLIVREDSPQKSDGRRCF